MSRINFFVNTLMWSFRILCQSQACISFGLQGFVAKLLTKQQYSQGWLQTGSAMEDLMWNTVYVENIKYRHLISVYTFFFYRNNFT